MAVKACSPPPTAAPLRSGEAGRGRYTAAGTTLSRDLIYESTNSGSAISLSGSAQVFVTGLAEDFVEATLLSHARLGGI